MRLIGYVIPGIVFLAISSIHVFPQQCTKEIAKETRPWQTANKEDYSGWRKIEMFGMSMYLPSRFSKLDVKCLDSGCSSFNSDDEKIEVDISIDAGFPTTPITEDPTFCNEYFQGNLFWVWVWHYRRSGEFPYVSGALFTFNEKKAGRIGIYFTSKKPYDHELFRKIISSVSVR